MVTRTCPIGQASALNLANVAKGGLQSFPSLILPLFCNPPDIMAALCAVAEVRNAEFCNTVDDTSDPSSDSLETFLSFFTSKSAGIKADAQGPPPKKRRLNSKTSVDAGSSASFESLNSVVLAHISIDLVSHTFDMDHLIY